MQRILIVVAIMSVACGSAQALPPLPVFDPGDVLHASDLNTMVDHIKALGGPNPPPVTITVDCLTKTIGQALEEANPGDIIQVSGTCNETVLIIKDGITLDGGGTTIIDGGGPLKSVIAVDGAQRVTIQGLTAQNGEHGIVIRRGAAAILVDVTATGNAEVGIFIIDNATARFKGTIVSKDNGDDGIAMFRGGNAFFDAVTVQLTGNGGAGLNFFTNGHGAIQNSTLDISNNTSDGMRAHLGSAVRVLNSTITLDHNGARGLLVSRSTAVDVRTSTITATNNTTDGIGVFNGSSLLLQDATAPIDVSSNGDRGVEVSLNATLSLVNSTMTVTNNTVNDGIGVFNSSSFFIRTDTGKTPALITVSGNGKRGVAVGNTSTLLIQHSQLNTTSNTDFGVEIFGSSRLQIILGSTVLSENNTVGVRVVSASSISALGGTPLNTLTVQNNSGNGLQLNRTSSANLAGTTTASDNGTLRVTSSGISLNGSSSASLSGTTLVQGNPSQGILVNRASSLIATGTLNVLSNGEDGIRVHEGSTLRLLNGTMVIDGNTMNGIGVFHNSEARLAPSVGTSDLDLQIRNNVLQGIFVFRNSSVGLETGTVITKNTGDGLQARQSSVIRAFGVSVTANGGNGLDVDESSANVNTSTITGNTATDVTATFGARLTLKSNTIGTVACDTTVLKRVDGLLVTCAE